MSPSSRTHGRGFTLIELIIAAIIAVIVVAALGTSLSQLARARATSKVRLSAHLRASAALERIRHELQQVIRSDELIDTRVLLTDTITDTPIGDTPRNELLIYTTKLSPVRTKAYEGDGLEHETQLRIVEDDDGSTLWIRTDSVPDENDEGGGRADPIMDGIIGLHVEAFDGSSWYDTWDSDIFGLPHALRVTVTSGGDPLGEDLYADAREFMSLRTIIPIDRVMPPFEESVEEESAVTGGDVAAGEPETGAGAGASAAAGAIVDPTAGVPAAGTGMVSQGGASGSAGGTGRGNGRGNPGSGTRGGGGARGRGAGGQTAPARPSNPGIGGGPN